MKKISIIVLNDDNNIDESKIKTNINDIEIIYSKDNNVFAALKNSNAKYVTFINNSDEISDDYFDKVLGVTNKEFDTCHIGFDIDYEYIKPNKYDKDYNRYEHTKPNIFDYIWSFIYNKEKLYELLSIFDKNKFKEYIKDNIQIVTAINEIIYHHKNKGTILFKNNILMNNRKKTVYYDNILFMENGINCVFNGYLSWLYNLRDILKDEKIIILCDEVYEPTKKRMDKYFNIVLRNLNTNYVCKNLWCTYSTFLPPQNVIFTNESTVFIHGTMRDYSYTVKENDDYYNNYIAVSKVARDGAIGYYNTDKIDYILNPYIHDKENLKKHMYLVSAQRYSDEKRVDRIEKMARMFDEMELPYTWDLFTDNKEGTNVNGLVYRTRVPGTINYFNGANYVVLLSDSEACSYTLIEALCTETKVILSSKLKPLADELGVEDGKNGFIIDCDLFEEGNEDKLKEKLEEIYEKQDMKFSYTYKMDEIIKKYKNLLFK